MCLIRLYSSTQSRISPIFIIKSLAKSPVYTAFTKGLPYSKCNFKVVPYSPKQIYPNRIIFG